jgi:rod shape-determining protein MreD
MASLYLPLLPLGTAGGGAVWPDTVFALTAAWIIRQPDGLPLLAVAAAGFLADLVLFRPPGLGALLLVLATEFLRVQRPAMMDRPFPVEWLTFGLTYAACLLLQSAIMAIAFVAQPPARLTALMFVATLAVYPAVAAFLHWVLQVRFPMPAERVRQLGRKLS